MKRAGADAEQRTRLSVKQSSRTKVSFKQPRSFAQRMQKRSEHVAGVQAERHLIDSAKAKRAAKAKRIQDKREKRKQEDLRAGNVQVVKKLRKLDRKALNKLIKMTPEQIQALAK